MKYRVLVYCTTNSARSQIAEAYLNKYCNGQFEIESAGLEAGELNELAVQVMKEEGIDISGNKTKDVYSFYKDSKFYHYIIAVCDPIDMAQLPPFPGVLKRFNWSIPDSFEEPVSENQLSIARNTRDQIKEAVWDFIKQAS